MRRLSIAFLMMTISLLLVMSPVYAAGWTAEVTKLDLHAGPGRTAAFLAPDGSRFAYINSDELCIYTITGEKGDCAVLAGDLHMDEDTVRWSPDSTKLAFSEDFLITFRDSDIWIYDVETNTLKDVTPAPNREIKIFANEDPNVIYTVDMIPQWSSDSQSIYFIRYSFSKVQLALAKFFRLSLKDNSIEEIAPVDTRVRMTTYGFALSPDDSTIAYNLDTRGSEKDGTWFLDIATKKSKFAAAPVQDTAPWTYQFSQDGSLLLSIGVDLRGGFELGKPEGSPIYTLPVSGGRQQQLNVDSYVFSAGWGPEGSELAYATFDQLHPEKQGLYITDAPGQPGDMVLSGRFIAPSPRVRTPIIWAANNTILLSQTPDFKLVVVHLTQS